MYVLFYIIIALLFLVIILALIAPKTYNVSRSITIKKPLSEVFSYVRFLKNQDNWSPWSEKDPNMNKTFTGVDGEIGFVSAWEGNKEVGSGEQEITKVIENEAIYSELRFFKPFKSTSNAYLKVEKDGEETNVIWGFSGNNKFPMSIMMLFMSMDKMIGKDFEFGLNKLKSILEK